MNRFKWKARRFLTIFFGSEVDSKIPFFFVCAQVDGRTKTTELLAALEECLNVCQNIAEPFSKQIEYFLGNDAGEDARAAHKAAVDAQAAANVTVEGARAVSVPISQDMLTTCIDSCTDCVGGWSMTLRIVINRMKE